MPRFYLTLALAWIWGWQAASAGDNENVEIGVSALSEPCGQSGGDRVEFLVAARQMSGARQISMILRWAPLDAVVGATAQADPDLDARGFIDFQPLLTGVSAEYGMGAFSDSIDGEAVLARFSLELAPHIAPNARVEIWVDLVSLGPEFARHDTIRPLQAHILTNYCDATEQIIERALFVQPEQTRTPFSASGSGRLFDSSAGEILLEARPFLEGRFPTDQPVVWTIANQGIVPIFALAAEGTIEIPPDGNIEGTSRGDRRGRSLILLDAEADASNTSARATVTVCAQVGGEELCTPAQITWMAQETAIVQESASTLPARTDLAPNYPNPFNAETTISFSLAEPRDLRLDILDVAGQRVAGLATGSFSPGRYLYRWNGRDVAGHNQASGVYFYRLRLDNAVFIRPMLLLR